MTTRDHAKSTVGKSWNFVWNSSDRIRGSVVWSECALSRNYPFIFHTTSLCVQKILLLPRETMRTTLHKKSLQVQIAD